MLKDKLLLKNRTNLVQVSLIDLEATNPSLLLTTDPNLEFCNTENMHMIPLLQSIELNNQNSLDNFLLTKTGSSTNQNSHKNLNLFSIIFIFFN